MVRTDYLLLLLHGSQLRLGLCQLSLRKGGPIFQRLALPFVLMQGSVEVLQLQSARDNTLGTAQTVYRDKLGAWHFVVWYVAHHTFASASPWILP